MDALPLLTTSDKICINFCIPSIFWNKKVKRVDEEKAEWKKKIKKVRSRRKRMGGARGMAMGRDGSEGWGFRPHPTWFCLKPSLPRPAPHDGKNFPAQSPPLGPLWSPTPPSKTLLLVNLPTTITIFFFFYETYFVSKNILEITNKFIPSNQTNF